MAARGKQRNPVMSVVLMTAAVMVPILLASVYLGFYAADAYGYSPTITAIAFSAAGLLISLVLVVKLAARIAAKSQVSR